VIFAASDFVTVFEITRNSNGFFADEVFQAADRVAALLGSFEIACPELETPEAAQRITSGLCSF